MPQMAPMSWLMLFIIFSLTYILFCMINYYSFNYSINLTNMNQIKKNSINWKW